MPHRVSGFWFPVFLFPLVVDQVQERAQLPRRAETLGGEFLLSVVITDGQAPGKDLRPPLFLFVLLR